MENLKSIVEGGIPKPEKMKIVKVMRNNSFLNYRDDLEKHGMKVEFETSPYSYYKITHRKWGRGKDGKESSIFITSKRNVGSDAEYVSNDNVAMGELTEAISGKMKTREQLMEIAKEVLLEKFKVGDKVKFNGDYDGVITKVHASGKLKGMVDVQKKGRSSTVTLDGNSEKEVRLAEAKQPDLSKYPTKTLRDLYKVLYGKANTAKEKAGVEKIRAELVKRKVIKKEDSQRHIDISEDDGANINVHALSSSEIQLAVGAINFFGTGSHPMADAKGLKYFKVDYLADIIAKNKNKLEATARKHLDKLVKKLQKSTNEETISEGDDLRFVIDQLANSMEHYDEKEFVSHMSKETKYDANQLKKVFNAYWKVGAMDRFNMGTDINKTKKFLAKLGIK